MEVFLPALFADSIMDRVLRPGIFLPGRCFVSGHIKASQCIDCGRIETSQQSPLSVGRSGIEFLSADAERKGAADS
jgi:hypothetical protein